MKGFSSDLNKEKTSCLDLFKAHSLCLSYVVSAVYAEGPLVRSPDSPSFQVYSVSQVI